MGGKKGGGKKKAGKGDEEEDFTVDNFMKFYKRKVIELQCPISKRIKELYDVFLDEAEPITEVIHLC